MSATTVVTCLYLKKPRHKVRDRKILARKFEIEKSGKNDNAEESGVLIIVTTTSRNEAVNVRAVLL